MDYDQWYTLGLERGWISPAYCAAHDRPPMTDLEVARADAEGYDVVDSSVPAARLYPPS